MKARGILYLVLIVVSVCLLLYAGLFLFTGQKEEPSNGQDYPGSTAENTAGTDEEGFGSGADENGSGGDPAGAGSQAGKEPENDEDARPAIRHEKISEKINGAVQMINVLEINLNKAGVKPALSFDVIYGFEELSAIVARTGAYAAVNGGFFSEYGEPGGMVMIDGRMYTPPTGRYPVLIVEEDSARFEEYKCRLFFNSVHGSTARENTVQRIELQGINIRGKPSAAVVYTPVYGTTNRANGENITVFVADGKIDRIEKTTSPSSIPRNGMLLSFYPPYPFDMEALPFKPGDEAWVEYTPYLGENVNCYECGVWLVRNGENVAPRSDAWVGVLTNRDPRTAVGIKDDGKTVVLFTVDGRQPEYSEGMTAKELADYFVGLGVKDAAMLDGGASTEMIVDGEMVSRPSYKGMERKIAGALVVNYKE